MRGTVTTPQLGALDGSTEWVHLCAFVRQLREAELVPEPVLMAMLTVSDWSTWLRVSVCSYVVVVVVVIVVVVDIIIVLVVCFG